VTVMSRAPRTNKELEKLAKQWFFRCFHCEGLFAVPKAPRSQYFCADCKAAHVTKQRQAGAAMARARRAGWNDVPSNHACVDCGVQAEVWEHRAYGAALDVVPTCHSCNVLRGPAKLGVSA
jgi:hypothetical protein